MLCLGSGRPVAAPSITSSRVPEQGSTQLLRDAWEKVKNLFCVFPKKPSLQETAYCEQDSAFSAEPELGCGHWHWGRWKPGCRVGSRDERGRDSDRSSSPWQGISAAMKTHHRGGTNGHGWVGGLGKSRA